MALLKGFTKAIELAKASFSKPLDNKQNLPLLVASVCYLFMNKEAKLLEVENELYSFLSIRTSLNKKNFCRIKYHCITLKEILEIFLKVPPVAINVL